jgi:DNA-binding response OmpR family regulator
VSVHPEVIRSRPRLLPGADDGLLVALASVLISEVEPDVRRLLVLLVERRGHAAIALDANVVVPPRADVLLLDPIAPTSVEHARLARALFPELPVVCLNPLPKTAGFLDQGPTYFLPKPFAPDQLDVVLQRVLDL